MHLQERVAESNQLKAQLAETAAKLTATQAELEQARQKTEALDSPECGERKTCGYLERTESGRGAISPGKDRRFNKAVLTIQSLKQEVDALPQAIATVQNLLDERNKEFDQMKSEDRR
jgi:peptidoglycan hydrolase CwlO-like protein